MSTTQDRSEHAPRVFLFDAETVLQRRRRLLSGEDHDDPALQRLIARANAAMRMIPPSVLDKPQSAPSGDPKDYLSLGTYWWPNPDTPDGLPWVSRDGQVNPTSMDTDCGRFRKLTQACRELGMAAFLTGNQDYAEKLAELVRHWFLDARTGMNPNLRHAQCIPGISEGRSYGIIDTCVIRHLLDAVGLIESFPAWSERDRIGLGTWCGQFLHWLLSDRMGQREAVTNNNHGTWYDVQAVSLALHVGRLDIATRIAEQARERRIDIQIEPDGTQPEELKRSRPLTYVSMNLHAFCELASLAQHTTVDLWNYRSRDGRSIQAACTWLLPYLTNERARPKREIIDYVPENYLSVFRRAANVYRDIRFEPEELPLDQSRVASDPIQLLYPRGRSVPMKQPRQMYEISAAGTDFADPFIRQTRWIRMAKTIVPSPLHNSVSRIWRRLLNLFR